MSDGRHIAIVRDYDGLIAVLRDRAAELGVRREALDSVAGLQSGYSAKLLSPVPMRRLGVVSMGPMLQALGLAIIVVEDLEALSRVKHRFGSIQRRADPGVGKHDVINIRITRNQLRRLARRGGKMRAIKLSAKRRRAIAKRAARARWAKHQ